MRLARVPFDDFRVDELDERPTAPDENAVWDGRAWRVLSAAQRLATLERVRPCPGVAPGADRRLDGQPAVPWRLLDARLAGIEQRRGRTGDAWLWAPERSAGKTMHDVRAQTARASTITAHDLREPTWLRDAELGLSPRELRLVCALVCAYETGWGGLYDCQSTIAVDLSIGCERTLRNLLWGTSWRRKDGTQVRRPGLVERGFVQAIQTFKPGDRRGRPSDFDWLLLRVGPAIERVAAWTTLAKTWTGRAPRGSGWTRSLARKFAARLRGRAGRNRFDSAGAAWALRGHEPTPIAAPENRTPSSSTSTPIAVEPSSSSPIAVEPSSSSTPARETGHGRRSGPLVGLDVVDKALARIRGARPTPARSSRAELDQARAECDRLARDFPELADLPLEVPPKRPALNWAASPAENPSTQGPPSGAPWDGVGGSGGSPSPAQGRPLLLESKPLARFPFEPSFADRSGAVRPTADTPRPPSPGPLAGLTRVASRLVAGPSSTAPPPSRAELDERSERLAALGGAAGEAAPIAAALGQRDPELGAALLDLVAAWALEGDD